MAYTPNFQNEMGFWNENKPTDRYAGFENTAQNYANQFFSRAASRPDPTAGGFAGWQSSWGGAPDIEDPNTVRKLGVWKSFLEGNMKNYLDQNARTTSNLSAATSRFGPAGGPSQASQNQAGVNQAIAQQAGNITGQSMGYMTDAAKLNEAAASQYLDAYAKMYGIDVNAGQGLLGQVLTALKSGGDEFNQWLQGAGAAKGRDVATQNEWEKELVKRNDALQAQAAANEAANQKQQAIWRASLGTTEPNSGLLDPLQYQLIEYARAMGWLPQEQLRSLGKGSRAGLASLLAA